LNFVKSIVAIQTTLQCRIEKGVTAAP
jgi:hypothetical protein